jgi:hypothetical protein
MEYVTWLLEEVDWKAVGYVMTAFACVSFGLRLARDPKEPFRILWDLDFFLSPRDAKRRREDARRAKAAQASAGNGRDVSNSIRKDAHMNALRWIAALAIAIAIAVAALSVFAADDLDTTPAMAAAERWIAGVDAGRYAQSWEEAAPFFKESVAKVEWEKALDSTRGALGVANARKLRSATYTKTLPGAPEGEYVVIQYDTQFQNRPASTETVTPMRDKDGSWKIAGYFIR